MEITLRNGEKINLDWNPVVLEYLEEYDGGIEQIKKDIENENTRFRAFNSILYSAICAVYPEELTYKQAVGLVDINDIEKIADFIIKNMNQIKLSNSQKIQRAKRPHRR